MPDFANFLKKLDPDPKKAGSILVGLNVMSMVLAALSNTFGASVDKNTSKEDKKFLVPAGAVTGIANIGLYYFMTQKIIKGLQKSADKAISGMEATPGKIETLAFNFANKKINKAEKGFLGTGLFKKSDEYIQSMKKTLLNEDLTAPSKEAIKDFKGSLKGGAGVLGAFVGAVVGCSILTPIIRDVSAYFVQMKMEKKNPDLSKKDYRPYFEPGHLQTSRYRGLRRRPMTFKNYVAFTRGNMKV